jgi:MoaA/NifB/PqqE/SkfB family radical SAM enzyme
MDKLREIGFYTLEDKRAKNVSMTSPLWRCELLVTSHCNFNCPYCRGVKKEYQGNLTYKEAINILNLWIKDGLKNVRFSGGEPTLWPNLEKIVKYCKKSGVEKIAISTNGSARLQNYLKLYEAGVNDFSISFDACCSSTGNIMAGIKGSYDIIAKNIGILSKLTYVTVGVVLTETNMPELNKIIELSTSLGVSDIRLITAAQIGKYLPKEFKLSERNKNMPILNYRLKNIRKGKPIRGISTIDNYRCPLVIDDMAVLQGKHYPCIIYLREYGDAIGNVSPNMRKERFEWYMKHNCFEDEICKNNCLDVCVDYNNRVLEFMKKGEYSGIRNSEISKPIFKNYC